MTGEATNRAAPVPVSALWDFLGDIPSVATRMPGARLTKTVDESTSEGLVRVGIGPPATNYERVRP
jgi:carbon monoxide dehydrogenase subunit G